MKEIVIEGYPNYIITDAGIVINKTGLQMKQKTTSNGYKAVTLYNKGISKEFLVHRLVALAFVINTEPDLRPDVNHEDTCKTNNNYTNLKWVSKLENQQHAFDNGRYTQSKVVYKFTLDGEYLACYRSASKAAYAHGMDGGCVSKVCRGVRNHAGGFIWSYDRPKEDIFMDFALSLASLSKCTQRGVAAVATDGDFNQVYSIGINGAASKGIECLCALLGKETCVHAEAACIGKSCTTDKTKVMFCTLSPCVTCASLIINTGFSKVYYNETWKNDTGLKLLSAAGIAHHKI